MHQTSYACLDSERYIMCIGLWVIPVDSETCVANGEGSYTTDLEVVQANGSESKASSKAVSQY